MREDLKIIKNTIFFKPAWYAILANPYFIARRNLYRGIYKFSKTIADKKILDLGCGSKPYLSLFNGSSYTGIDVSGGGHKDSAKEIDRVFDGKNIPFGDEQFDVVICTQVLEHAEEPGSLLREVHRVLNKSGKIYFTCPFVWPEHEIPYDFRRYTQYGLRKIFKENNFSIESISAATGLFGTVGQLISAFFFEAMGKHTLPRLLMAVIICFPVQLIFSALDFIFRHKGIALDYIVIAEKYEI